jgi:hypothetical protein
MLNVNELSNTLNKVTDLVYNQMLDTAEFRKFIKTINELSDRYIATKNMMLEEEDEYDIWHQLEVKANGYLNDMSIAWYRLLSRLTTILVNNCEFTDRSDFMGLDTEDERFIVDRIFSRVVDLFNGDVKNVVEHIIFEKD